MAGTTILSRRTRIAALSCLLCLLFAPAMVTLVKVWYTQEDYGHGFFVIPIVGYMLWNKRDRLKELPVRPSWAGFPILVGGSVLYVASTIAKFHTLTYLCMVAIVFGLVLFLAGWRVAREVAPQVALLVFMFPIPSAFYVQITNPLKLAVAKLSTGFVRTVGIPVLREGNLLCLPNSQMEVTEACSGIRSLYSFLMLGCIFAFSAGTGMIKVVLILSAVPLAFFVNVVRVTGTTVLSYYYGPEVAEGYPHLMAGFVVFAIGLALFYVEYTLLDRAPFRKQGDQEVD